MKTKRILCLLTVAFAASLLRAAEIHDAAESGDMAKVIALLKQTPALVSQKDKSGNQPLHLAARKGRSEIIVALLGVGAEVNAKGFDGNTPLHFAAISGSADACHMLLDAGANRDALNGVSRKPQETARGEALAAIRDFVPKVPGTDELFKAIEAGEAEKVKALIAANPQILQAKDAQGETPLVRAATTSTVNDASATAIADMKFLPDGSPDPAALRKLEDNLKSSARDEFGGSLQAAMAHMFKPAPEPVREAKRAILRLLLEAGADPKKDESAIIFAAMSGETEMVRLLLERGADPNAEKKGTLPFTTIQGAVMAGAPLPLIRQLLAAGADPLRIVNPKLPNGSALSLAVAFKNEEVIAAILASLKPVNLSAAQHAEALSSLTRGGPAYLRRALDAGFKVNAKGTDGKTALMVAAAIGSAESVRLLLAAGADVSARDQQSITALGWAMNTDSTEASLALIEAGADVNAQDEAGFTPLASAVERHRTAQVSALLAHGAKLELAIKDGPTPLLLAAGFGYADIVDLLLKAGAKATVVWAKDGSNALHAAADSGRRIQEEGKFKRGEPGDYATIVKLLLDAGLPVDRPSHDGFTALHLAASSGNVEVARLLLAKGAKVGAVGKDGRTPLHLAAFEGTPEMIAFLLDHGAAIDAVQASHPSKSTPLAQAEEKNHVENVKLLLKRGANVQAKVAENRLSLLHTAAWHNHLEIAKILLAAGIKVDVRDADRGTPLVVAVSLNSRDVAKLLIEQGADVNARFASGDTILKVATVRGQTEIAALLKAHGAKE